MWQEELRLELHDKVVSTLASPLLKNSESLLPVLFKAAAENGRAKNLVLFVILWLIDHAPKGKSPISPVTSARESAIHLLMLGHNQGM